MDARQGLHERMDDAISRLLRSLQSSMPHSQHTYQGLPAQGTVGLSAPLSRFSELAPQQHQRPACLAALSVPASNTAMYVAPSLAVINDTAWNDVQSRAAATATAATAKGNVSSAVERAVLQPNISTGGNVMPEVLAVSRHTIAELDSVLANKTKAGVEEEMKDLLECLATSTSLVELGVEAEWISQHAIRVNSLLLGKSSQCQQRRRIKWELPLPMFVAPLPFLGIMTNLASLQELNVRFVAGRGYNRIRLSRERDAIAKAFQSNRTLQKLVLSVLGDQADQDVFTAILAALHEHPTLRELHCSVYDSSVHSSSVYAAAVSDFVGCPTCKLERLSIGTLNRTRSDMTRLLSGLQRAPVAAGGLPTTLLCSLRLDHCHLGFDEEALEVLFAFLDTPTENPRGQTIYQSSLNELSLVGNRLDDDLSIRLAASLTTAAAAATDDQDADTSVSTPTIGSQIQTCAWT